MAGARRCPGSRAPWTAKRGLADIVGGPILSGDLRWSMTKSSGRNSPRWKRCSGALPVVLTRSDEPSAAQSAGSGFPHSGESTGMGRRSWCRPAEDGQKVGSTVRPAGGASGESCALDNLRRGAVVNPPGHDRHSCRQEGWGGGAVNPRQVGDCRNRAIRKCRRVSVPVGACPVRNTIESGDYLMTDLD